MFASFGPVGAQVVGTRTNVVDYVLLIMLALVFVTEIQAAGSVLIMAMLAIPAAAAYLLVRRFVPVMMAASVIGTMAAATGLYVSYHFNLPTGPAMTLVASGIFVLAVSFRRRAHA